MNITREQYEADIRKAKAEAWGEGVEIGANHALLARLGVTVDDLHNPYQAGGAL